MTRIPDDLARYHRQTLLPQVGVEGQRRLGSSHALIVGCGALGTVASEFLARAGVGRLTIVDRDVVEPTNLQRQVLFDEADAREGIPKAEAARRKLGAINSTIDVRAVVADFGFVNAERVGGFGGGGGAQAPDVIVDGTDNFETRYLLNDLSIKHGVPYVYAGAVGVVGTGFVVRPSVSPCLRCLYPEVPAPGTTATCDTAGVLGPLVGMVASWQAIEAIKILVGADDAVSTGLHTWDAWKNESRRLDVGAARDPECPCCAHGRFEFLEGRGASRTVTLCGRDAVQITPAGNGASAPIDLPSLAVRLAPHAADVTANTFLVRATLADERGADGEPVRLTVFADARAVVQHASGPDHARSIHARYVGA